MNHGQIFADTFRVIWREKRLWLFALLGLALSTVAGAVGALSGIGFQRNLLQVADAQLTRPGPLRPELFFELFGPSMAYFAILLGLVAMLSLLGYLVNLVMRAAGISEAGVAWQGQAVALRRGATNGVNHVLKFIVVDLIWAVLPVVVGVGAYVGLLGVVFSIAATADAGGDEPGAILGVLGVVFAVVCLLLLFALVYVVANAIFAPMMYQAAAQGNRSLGAALREGWQLGKAHWGSMILFGLMIWGLSLVLGLVVQLLVAPFGFSMMGVWMRGIAQAAQGGSPMVMMPGMSMIGLVAVVSAVVGYFTSSLLQTFRLTLYARVYQEFTANVPEPVYSAAQPMAGPATDGGGNDGPS